MADGAADAALSGRGTPVLPDWLFSMKRLQAIASRQLFFIGGAPRSGTTWLQQILDAHPDIDCRGEGLFSATLAGPLDRLVAHRRQALHAKNSGLFAHTVGYPLPDDADADALLGTAVLLSLGRHVDDPGPRALGEKTPENVFLFPRLHRLFPTARFIGIVRDPRDVLASAWCRFGQPAPGEDENRARLAFVRSALPSLNEGARAMLEIQASHPDSCLVVTYESMISDGAEMVACLFRHLDVRHDPDVVERCLAATSFVAMSGRRPGDERREQFLRKGIVGDWRNLLSPDVAALVMRELGWMFPAFGWEA